MRTRRLLPVVAAVVVLATGLAGAHGWSVAANAQVVGDGTVVLDHVSLLEGGYVAVHVVEDGEPGRVLGARRFPDQGESTNVAVSLDTTRWPDVDGPVELVAVIHEDDGDAEFDWPDGDPIYRADDPIVDRFTARRDDGASARVVAVRQASDGTVTLRRVDMPAAGFVVLYEEVEGERGQVVGVRNLTAGHHEGVTVDVAPRYYNGAGSRLYLVAGLHVDDGDGVWEPDEDDPVAVGDAVVAATFDAETTRSSLPTPTPTATPVETDAATATRTPTSATTPTASPARTVTASPTPATSPGFGVAAALAALGAALLALGRRR